MLYNTKENAPFSLMHCFKILEKAPKWSQHLTIKQNSTPTTKRKRSTTSQEPEEEAVELPGCEDGNSSAAGSSRPMGQKASKTAEGSRKSLAAASIAMADNGRVLANLTKQKLEDSIQRTAAYKQMVNHAIMSVDVEKMSGVAREYYLLEQTRILNETRKAAGNIVEQTYEEILSEVPINEDCIEVSSKVTFSEELTEPEDEVDDDLISQTDSE
nr:uncharacterized protein LOC109423072 [Aedes albopictus]